MPKYINAAECAEIISEKFNISLDDLVDVFAEIPAADVVEVVRCKECKKRLTSDCSLWYGNLNGNDYFVGVEDDFGCIRGERRKD